MPPTLLISRVLRSVFTCRQASSAVKLKYEKVGGKDVAERKHTPLVILHGIFGFKSNWRTVSYALNERLKCTVFALDMRNHGESPWCSTMSYEEMAEDVRYFINETIPQETGGRRQVHLLGHSMGGKIAMRLALMPRSEQYLKSLIVEDIAPRSYGIRNLPLIIEAMKCVDLEKTRSQIDNELAQIVTDKITRQFLLMNLIQNHNHFRWQINLDVIAREIKNLSDIGIQKTGIFYKKTLFISGALSEYILKSDHQMIQKIFPNTQFIVIPNARHWVHADRPYEFINAIATFIRSVEPI